MFRTSLVAAVLAVCSLQAAEGFELLHLNKTSIPSLRIINGVEAPVHAAPYIAAIFLSTPNGASFCGGSLISPNYILTAAHCVYPAQQGYAILGAHNYTQQETGQIHVTRFKMMKYHADYHPQAYLNDIALIELPVPIAETQFIKYAKLPSKADASKNYVGTQPRAYGWGLTRDDNPALSQVLNQVDLSIVNNNQCLNDFPTVNDNNICTSGANVKKVCIGDSGGPLILDGTLVGLVSFGTPKCVNTSPNVFTKVVNYLDWIKYHSDAVIH